MSKAWSYGLIAVWDLTRRSELGDKWSILSDLTGISLTCGKVVDIMTGETYQKNS